MNKKIKESSENEKLYFQKISVRQTEKIKIKPETFFFSEFHG